MINVYFSPTHTTKKIVSAIAESWGINEQKIINLNSLTQRHNFKFNIQSDEAMILGIPVYNERIPDLLYPALSKIKGNGQPMVIIATYGNISAGITLKQLTELMRKQGFKIIAAASFIGEHSFSRDDTKIAPERPDVKDLEKARLFGKQISQKIASIDKIENIPELNIKGKLRAMGKLLPRHSEVIFTCAPFLDSNLCQNCKKCLDVCPVNAIDKKNLKSREKLCIRCFACVKFCPNNARKIIYKKPIIVKHALKKLGKKRSEPEIYI